MNPIVDPQNGMKLEDMVQRWYADFCYDVEDRVELMELVTASNFMNIVPLLDLACLAVAVGNHPHPGGTGTA